MDFSCKFQNWFTISGKIPIASEVISVNSKYI